MTKPKLSDEFEYKGWFFACPVYLNFDGDGAEVAARFECLEWWFSINAAVCQFMIGLMSMANPNYEPAFPFRVTGKIRGDKIDKIN